MIKNKHLTRIILGKIIKYTPEKQSMKMENPKKNLVRNTYTTLKECLTDKMWLKALEKLSNSEKRAYKEHLYD